MAVADKEKILDVYKFLDHLCRPISNIQSPLIKRVFTVCFTL